MTQLGWFDRSGKQIEAMGDPAQSIDIQLAPDGSRAVMRIFDVARRTSDIWLVDVRRGLRTRALDDRLIAADVDGRGPAFQVGTVRPLFNARPPDGADYVYDVTPDGQRFLIHTLVEKAASAPITLVVNWPAALKQREAR